jgi:hypothetical protein
MANDMELTECPHASTIFRWIARATVMSAIRPSICAQAVVSRARLATSWKATSALKSASLASSGTLHTFASLASHHALSAVKELSFAPGVTPVLRIHLPIL